MLADLQDFGKLQTLVMNSGVQFLDFGLKIDWNNKEWRNKNLGCFVAPVENSPLRRLLEARDGSGFFDPARHNFMVEPDHEVNVEHSLKLFEGVWLPIPVLRTLADSFDEGPFNWARARFVKLANPDNDGNNYRFTFAFDTKVFPNRADVAYLSPTEEDVRSGVQFKLAHQSDQMSWFLDIKWVNEWLLELFNEMAPLSERLNIHNDDMHEYIDQKLYQAHYLNVLSILGTELNLPKLKVVSNKVDDSIEPIAVDMVLDVGNSRSCAVLIEYHKQEQDSLKKCYELELRDLTYPEQVYRDPFESRVEFSQAFFGKEHFSVRSGRRDAFQWATIARVGKEASHLASRREGNEGSTGLSSPKRYLWDRDNYEMRWRFNSSYIKTDSEPFATAQPLSDLINDSGEALYTLSDDIESEYNRKIPVFQPEYSRSSLMMFMLSEVLMHALVQINSPAQRSRMEHAHIPRHLRSIILTIPPAMPQPERVIFERALEQAIGLVWKCLDWDDVDNVIDFNKRDESNCYPKLPEILIKWDEATCGQVVYLFNETQNNYGGRPEEFFASLRRQDKEPAQKITIASIDIGGGTTDLVINDYCLDYDSDNNLGTSAYIKPVQRFRDGFRVAGDDILLDMIRCVVIESLERYIKERGVSDSIISSLLSSLIGTETRDAHDKLLRQQLTLQVFSPIGLSILKAYEQYDPCERNNSLNGKTFNDILLLENEQPTQVVLDYINDPICRLLKDDSFCILQVPLRLNLDSINAKFIRGHFDICKTFNSLSEVVNAYQCDILLLTGRPSRLPGVQSFFRTRLPLPVGRILPMHHYHTGNWYPFHKNGRIDDPKTTAVVGAMLCFLSSKSKLNNFYFTSSIMKAYSTVKYLGLLDNNNVMKSSNIYYRDIDLDNEDYEFPDQSFTVRGRARLGFKQIDVERWVASPLYELNIISDEWNTMLSRGISLSVTLGLPRSRNGCREQFEIKSIEASNNKSCRRDKDIVLKLNTMTDSSLGETQFWLDTGSIKL